MELNHIYNIVWRMTFLQIQFYLDVEDFLNESMMRGPDGLWKCLSCDYSAKHTGHVRHHIESKHMSLEYSCLYCNKTCPTKIALSMHVHRNHKN